MDVECFSWNHKC